MSNLSFSDNSVALNINLSCQIGFQDPRFFVKKNMSLEKMLDKAFAKLSKMHCVKYRNFI